MLGRVGDGGAFREGLVEGPPVALGLPLMVERDEVVE